MKAEAKALLKPTLQITALSLVGILLNFITQMVIAYYFGASVQRDAYFAAITIPTYITSVLVGSLCVIFLPMYIDVEVKEGNHSANCFVNNAIGFIAVLTGLVFLTGVIFSHQIISFFFPGFKGENLAFTSKLFVWLLPTIICQVISNVISSVLQVQKKFIIPALAPIITALITLMVVLAINQYVGIVSLAYGTIAGSIVSTCIVFWTVSKTIKLKLSFQFNDNNIKRLAVVAFPLVIAAFVGKASDVFERMIASTLEKGSISYLGYARQMLVILATIATNGLATSIFPGISKAWSEGNVVLVREYFVRSVKLIFLVTLPIAAIFIVLGEPILSIVFERGAFNHDAVVKVSTALAVLMGSFFFMSLGSIISKIIYFTGQTRFGLGIAIVETIVYLSASYFFTHLFSYVGLAIASVLSTFISILTCLIVLIYLKVLSKKELLSIAGAGLLNIACVILLSTSLHYGYFFFIKRCNVLISTCFSVSLFLLLLIILYSFVFSEVKMLRNLIFQRVFKMRTYE
jgi:putative peptidoglycan lipid II flippase